MSIEENHFQLIDTNGGMRSFFKNSILSLEALDEFTTRITIRETSEITSTFDIGRNIELLKKWFNIE
jgi:hypothetical protein